jgi:hypothetical protein
VLLGSLVVFSASAVIQLLLFSISDRLSNSAMLSLSIFSSLYCGAHLGVQKMRESNTGTLMREDCAYYKGWWSSWRHDATNIVTLAALKCEVEAIRRDIVEQDGIDRNHSVVRSVLNSTVSQPPRQTYIQASACALVRLVVKEDEEQAAKREREHGEKKPRVVRDMMTAGMCVRALVRARACACVRVACGVCVCARERACVFVRACLNAI